MVLSALLAFVPLFVTVFFYWNSYRSATQKNIQDITENIMIMTSSHINYITQDIEDTSNLILTSQDVQDALSNPIYDKNGNPYTMAKYNEVNNLLVNLINNKTYCSAVYVGNSEVSISREKKRASMKIDSVYQETPKPEWFQTTEAMYGKGCWFNAANWDCFGETGLIFARTARHLYRVYPIGLIVIALDKSVLDGMVLDMQSSLPMGIILHKDGEVLYSFDNFSDESAMLNVDQIFESSENRFYTDEKNRHYYIANAVCSNAGWNLTVITDCERYDVSQKNMFLTCLSLMCATLLFMLFCSMLITNSITNQVTKLRNYVDQLKMHQKVETITFNENDEIGMIGNEFMNVVAENNKLMKKLYAAKFREKEAELISLQAQINPHFLYNTLDTIFWMATDAQQEQIADIAVSLSQLFRLSLNKGEQITTVRSEIELIKRYLAIQNIRYDNRFTVVYHIAEPLYICRIIKFMIQPIVENAIYHGLEKKDGKGLIEISIFEKRDFLYIVVRDDGVGFDSEKSDILNSGYAIRNIQKRIRLYYGEDCGLSIASKAGCGCTVTIQIRPDIVTDSCDNADEKGE